MAQMEASLKLIKPRPDFTLGKHVDIILIPVRCFVAKILLMDFALSQHQKWHKGCWQLPFYTLHWLKLPIASLCEGEGENSRGWINLLRDAPSREYAPLGLVDCQSRPRSRGM